MTEKHLNEEKRPARTRLRRQKLLVSKDRPGFVRRFVNETYGRVEMLEEDGWTVVEGQGEDISDSRIQVNKNRKNVVRRIVNRGDRAKIHTAILMEIPEELYNEMQAEKMADIDASEASIKKNVRVGEFGSDSEIFDLKRK
jgi:hypothetical protein